ncbi:MAG: AAA domain-containing protein [Bacteroidota bacterium]|jgi:hypothetical protein
MNSEQRAEAVRSLYGILSQALQGELDQLNTTRRGATLVSGEFLGPFAEYYYYRFEVPEDMWLQAVTQATFTLGHSDPVVVKGCIVSVSNQFVVVALPVDVGHVIPEVRCSWNFDEEMKPVIGLLSSIEDPPPIASMLFGLEENLGVEGTVEPLFPPDMPPHQQDAVGKMIRNSVTFLWGPSGSGESEILASATVNFVKAGKRVLYLTQTCERADGLLEEISRAGDQIGVNILPSALRAGFPLDLNSATVGQVSLELQSSALHAETRRKFPEVFTLLDTYRSTRIKQVLHEDFSARLDDLNKRLDEKKQQVLQISEELLKLRDALNRVKNASMLERMKKGFSRDESVVTQKQCDEKVASQKRLQAIQQNIASEISKLENNAPVTPERLREYQSALKRITELGGIDRVMQTADEYLKVDRSDLLRTKPLVIATVATALADPHFSAQQFDVVIIDNAERVNLAHLAVLALRSSGQMVVAGDPFQLEPESCSKSELAQSWLQQDIFVQVAGTRELAQLFEWKEQQQQSSVFLSPPDSEKPQFSHFFLSKLFPEKISLPASVKPRGTIYFIDTTDLHSKCRQYIGRKKILPFNDLQTKKTIECVKNALLQPHRIAGDIGVVVPFPGPTLSTKLQLRLHGIRNVEVGLPQGFVGRRKKAIIFDTTMSGVDYTMRPIDDKKAGEQFIMRLLASVLASAEEEVYILADMSHFQTRYKDRLFTNLLTLLKGHATTTTSFSGSAKKFDQLEWHQRAPLFEHTRKGPPPPSIAEDTFKTERTKGDIEAEVKMKMLEKQQAGSKALASGRNYELETYVAVNRVLGLWTDIDLLSQYVGGEALFRHTLATEQTASRLRIDFCQNEKNFSDNMHKWDLLIYQMSGGDKTDLSFFAKHTPESRVRWDINTLKVFYSSDVEAVVEEGRKKVAVVVAKLFQDVVGKSQPASPVEWSTAYLNFLTRMEKYLEWISSEVRK